MMPDGLGNQSQVRVIAEQLFEVWKADQAREARENRKWYQSNFAGWVATIVLLGGLVAGAVDVRGMATDARDLSARNEAEIAQMKANSSDRLARIETKIDLMMEERKR